MVSSGRALSTSRAYVSGSTYDPRLLVFEFSSNLILRSSQVKLIRKFIGSFERGESLCHQLIMGAGKTTVIAPVLALMLARRQTALVQVVPQALLEMTRSVLREKFSSLLQKPVYTFVFDRSDTADETLLARLEKARQSQAVILAAPTSIKSFALKFAEMVHILDEHADESHGSPGDSPAMGAGFLGFMLGNKKRAAAEQDLLTESDLAKYKEQVSIFPKIMSIFQSGVLLLDEVDLLLHPLKSGDGSVGICHRIGIPICSPLEAYLIAYHTAPLYLVI